MAARWRLCRQACWSWTYKNSSLITRAPASLMEKPLNQKLIGVALCLAYLVAYHTINKPHIDELNVYIICRSSIMMVRPSPTPYYLVRSCAIYSNASLEAAWKKILRATISKAIAMPKVLHFYSYTVFSFTFRNFYYEFRKRSIQWRMGDPHSAPFWLDLVLRSADGGLLGNPPPLRLKYRLKTVVLAHLSSIIFDQKQIDGLIGQAQWAWL